MNEKKGEEKGSEGGREGDREIRKLPIDALMDIENITKHICAFPFDYTLLFNAIFVVSIFLPVYRRIGGIIIKRVIIH